jgi:hypothetical protein
MTILLRAIVNVFDRALGPLQMFVPPLSIVVSYVVLSRLRLQVHDKSYLSSARYTRFCELT